MPLTFNCFLLVYNKHISLKSRVENSIVLRNCFVLQKFHNQQPTPNTCPCHAPQKFEFQFYFFLLYKLTVWKILTIIIYDLLMQPFLACGFGWYQKDCLLIVPFATLYYTTIILTRQFPRGSFNSISNWKQKKCKTVTFVYLLF